MDVGGEGDEPVAVEVDPNFAESMGVPAHHDGEDGKFLTVSWRSKCSIPTCRNTKKRSFPTDSAYRYKQLMLDFKVAGKVQNEIKLLQIMAAGQARLTAVA